MAAVLTFQAKSKMEVKSCEVNKNIKILIHQTTATRRQGYGSAWNEKTMFIKLIDRQGYFKTPWDNSCI